MTTVEWRVFSNSFCSRQQGSAPTLAINQDHPIFLLKEKWFKQNRSPVFDRCYALHQNGDYLQKIVKIINLQVKVIL